MLTQEQIKEAYDKDLQRLGQKVYDPAVLPVSFDDITAQWLTGTLCRHHPGADVVDYRIEPVEQGTTNRVRLHVVYNAAGSKAGLPTRLFCKASQGLSNRITLGLSGAAEAEVNFYNNARPFIDVEAPRAAFANMDADTFNSIVVLEDLSESVSEFCTQRTVITRAQVEDQLALLAKVHGAGYSDPRVRQHLDGFTTWVEYFNNTLAFGMREGSEEGFRRADDLIPPRLHKRHAEIWPATVAAVELNHTLPPTLAHGDVHLKNWYITDTGRMGLSDWQCVSRGHWGRDFGYTIGTALTIEDRRAWERDLMGFYLDHLAAAGGPKVSFDEGWLHYRRQLMTALTWWTITYNPAPGMPDMQPVETAREFVKRLATAMDDIESLDSFGEL
jgi:Phosphotransferase enzyme family